MIWTLCLLVIVIGALRIGSNLVSVHDVGFSICGDLITVIFAALVLYRLA